MNVGEKKRLVFVYNANSGFYYFIKDWLHKIFSPKTYQCNLCSLTWGILNEKEHWKNFISGLNLESEFLHRNELKKNYGLEDIKLPAVFIKSENNLDLLVSAKEINKCFSLQDLEDLISKKVKSN